MPYCRVGWFAAAGCLAFIGVSVAGLAAPRADEFEFPSIGRFLPGAENANPAPAGDPKKKPKPIVQAAPQKQAVPTATTKEKAGDTKLDSAQIRDIYIRRSRRLRQIREQQSEISKDREVLATNRARMQARLIETARALRNSEKRLTEIEAKVIGTRLKVNEQRTRLDEKSSQLSELFAVLQGMSRQPPPAIVTHSRDALNMIRSGMVLATFYTDVEKLTAQIATGVDVLERAQKDLLVQELRRKSEQSQNIRLKSQIAHLLAENHDQLEAINANLDGLKAAAALHAASMKNLEEMVPKLEEEVSKASGLGAYETELVQGAQAAPSTALAALPQPGRMKPAIPFVKAQGMLPLPVAGKIAIKYGQADQDGVASKGLHIETRPGAQVISPCDGWVIYAGQFRSYGQVLIISPGGGYHIVVAGMDRVQAAAGQFVLAGEPVAEMGNAGAAADTKAATRPTLYFEFRKDTQPIDPGPWWPIGVKG